MRPLWGWSWRGWVAPGVAVALAAVVAMGIDARWHIMKWAADAFGGVGLTIVDRIIIIPQWIALGSFFDLTALCPALAAFHVAPRGRNSVARLAVIGAWGALGPGAVLWSMWVWQWLNLPQDDWQYTAQRVLAHLITIALLGWAFRSWLVVAAVGAGTLAVEGMEPLAQWWGSYVGPRWLWELGYPLMLLVTLLPCAIYLRVRFIPPGLCSTCGYNPVGLPAGAPCPECGAAIGPAGGVPCRPCDTKKPVPPSAA